MVPDASAQGHRWRWGPRRWTRRRAGCAAEHGGHRGGAAGGHPGDDRSAGHRHAGCHRHGAAAGLGRAHAGVVQGRPDGEEGRTARHHCTRFIPDGLDASHRRAVARRSAARRRARDAAALSHVARPGLDRAAGRGHASRAREAARRHGDHRPGQRGHGTAEPGLHPHRRASRRARRPAARGCGQLHHHRARRAASR